jgi:hypothetical protein
VIFAISCSYMEAVLVFSNQQHEVTTTRAGLGWGLRSYALNRISARRALVLAPGLYDLLRPHAPGTPATTTPGIGASPLLLTPKAD